MLHVNTDIDLQALLEIVAFCMTVFAAVWKATAKLNGRLVALETELSKQTTILAQVAEFKNRLLRLERWAAKKASLETRRENEDE